MPSTTRRNLLRRALPRAGRQLIFQPEAGPAGDVLVLVFLRGGMDGLTAVPPHADAAYRSQRPTLAVPEPGRPGGTLDLDGFFGLHPDLAPLVDLFREKRLAIIHASGSPDHTLSHFEAMQTMERGVTDGASTASGWVARHLACREPENPSPLRAVALADVLPKSMQGTLHASALRSIAEFRLQLPELWRDPFRAALAGLYGAENDLAHTAGRGTLKLLARLEQLDPERYTPAGGAQYPETDFGRGLRQVAQLIKADVGLEVAQVDLGGWDSHAAQGALMGLLMPQLAQAMSAFHTDLGDRMDGVTLAAMSEFGRRVHENSALGTDHGRATAMFVLGGGIRGGRVYGEWPGLAPDRLDRDGNLRVTTDYRDILGELVARRLRNPEVARVFPQYQSRPLDLAAG